MDEREKAYADLDKFYRNADRVMFGALIGAVALGISALTYIAYKNAKAPPPPPSPSQIHIYAYSPTPRVFAVYPDGRWVELPITPAPTAPPPQ